MTKSSRPCGHTGGVFNRYNLVKIQRVCNKKLWERYTHRRKEVSEENHNHSNERMIFHGSPFVNTTIHKGFNERHSYIGGCSERGFTSLRTRRRGSGSEEGRAARCTKNAPATSATGTR
ncbi:poly [ADP-ribose] polymerase tankyrase-2-like isoform X3 [Anabas testudineus]|uniref:poly [ADP-ribose] polymerase tankyrase-2-like isoform X3 n=1 Tax=Anabas testudineus TaxID=64144 RepID=UPI00143D8FB6|nr:poly [ADP-ribose] polymerase tankyrase-2-like isoform X3 [Anabas testudineus]